MRAHHPLHYAHFGISTPIVCSLWSESLDEMADSVRRPFAWLHFTQAEFQTNQNLPTKTKKIIEQNGTFESTSRQRLVSNVLLHGVQRWRAAFSWLRRTREDTWSTYHSIPTFIMHSAAGYWGWFYCNNARCSLHLGRIEVGLHSYLKWTAPVIWSTLDFDCVMQT